MTTTPPPNPTTSSGTTKSPATVTDRRARVRAALPRRAQVWLMMALAVGLLGIILLTGNPPPTDLPRSTARVPVAPVEADRALTYQDELRRRQEELQRQMAALEATPPPAPLTDASASGETPRTDPLDEEKRRRDYQSLFASNVAFSDAMPTSADRTPRVPPVSGLPDPAALDAEARASLDRLNATVAALQQATGASSPKADAPVAPAPTSRQASPPAETPPILPGTERHRLLEGTVVDGTLVNRLEGDFAGPVLVLISTPVYSHNGDAVVIPAGSRVLGRAQAVDTWGQRRLAVSFHRVLLPDGATYSLDQFTGLDQVGATGLADQVNHHYLSTFGAAAAIGLISGIGQYVGGGALAGDAGDDRTVVITGGTTSATAQAVAQVMNRYTNRLPTIRIREGHRIKVLLTQDLDLPTYVDSRRVVVRATTGG